MSFTLRVLAGLVLVYAALLRFDAVTLVHGPVDSPGWLRAVQETRPPVSNLRPGSMTWQRWEGRYISDPYTYLQYARESHGFYAAHRREPVFVFSTRAWLWLLDDQDRAVSRASAMFSVLAVWATYLLGRLAWSAPVGVLAALLMAIEMENITWGAGGWRDDAFTCVVVLVAHGVLRLRQSPTRGRAVLLGLICALACLTRITALSFVVPALVAAWWLVPGAAADRRRHLGLATAVFLLALSPYLVNCWRTYGDPFYAINVHADVYRQAEGQMVQTPQTAREYLGGLMTNRPLRTLDTAAQGMTTYPFTNKWSGFDVWGAWIGRGVMWASLVGLVVFLTSGVGRFLLIVVAGSLVPYALTWDLIDDWRFTMHVYPFLLMAAAVALVSTVGLLRRASWREWRLLVPQSRRWWLWCGATVVVLAIGGWVMLVALPEGVARETLTDERVVTLTAGPRDRAFFVDGWRGPRVQGNVTSRISAGGSATLRLPVPADTPYDLLVRMDPAPAPGSEQSLPRVRLFVNGQAAGRIDLTYDPQRIGAYLIAMPATRHASVDLQFLVDAQPGQPDRLRFWWARIRLR
jgi:hypothetical protein